VVVFWAAAGVFAGVEWVVVVFVVVDLVDAIFFTVMFFLMGEGVLGCFDTPFVWDRISELVDFAGLIERGLSSNGH